MAKRTLSNSEKIILSFLAITIIVVAGNFALRPHLSRLSRLDREIELKEIELRKKLQLILRKERVAGRYQQYEECIRGGSFSGVDDSTVLKKVEGCARVQGLAIIDIKPKQSRPYEDCREYIVEVELESTVKGLVRFIHSLLESPNYLRVNSLRINSKGGSSGILKIYLQASQISLL